MTDQTPELRFIGAEALLIEQGYNEDGLRQKCRDLIRERDTALARADKAERELACIVEGVYADDGPDR